MVINRLVARKALVLSALVIWLHPPSAEAQATGRSVRGTVVSADGAPVAGALVQLARPADSTRTTDDGTFVFEGVHSGLYAVRIRALGYREKYAHLRVQLNSGWRGTIVVDPIAQQLPRVTVRAKGQSREAELTTKYADFFRRRRHVAGTFRDRDDFADMGAFDIASALRSIPGVSISSTVNLYGELETRVRIAGCQPPNLAVYVDGWRAFSPGSRSQLSGISVSRASNRAAETRSSSASRCDECVRLAETLSMVSLLDVMFLEFYRHAGQIPAELDRGGACSALAIWTR
jgi:hypothetical protein